MLANLLALRLTLRIERALHRVRLARARLAVGEDTGVVPIQRRLHKVPNVLKDGGLVGLWAEHAIEFEVVRHRLARLE